MIKQTHFKETVSSKHISEREGKEEKLSKKVPVRFRQSNKKKC